MTGWESLDRLLRTDALDVGCGQTMHLLDVYADLALAQASPKRRYPGVAVHLEVCDPCAQDYAGLLAAAAG